MTTTLGNHTAVIAASSEREKIRRFYCEVLGGNANVQSDEVDRIQLGDSHFCFLYKETALTEGDFLLATYLELKTKDMDELNRSILAFGVRKLDVPDVHLYFQAPGGQVFRVVGIDENLSQYELSPSTRPGQTSNNQNK